MGVLFGIVVLSLVVAVLAAGPLLAYRGAIRALARERARAGAYLLLAIPAIMGASFVIAWWFAGLPFDGRFALLASIVASAVVSRAPRRAVAMTGGPLDASASEARMHAELAAAENDLRRAERAAKPPLKRGGSKELAIRRKALDRAAKAQWPVPRPIWLAAGAASGLVLVGMFGWILVTGVDARRACIGSDLPSGRLSSVEMDTSGALADSLLTEPEPGAQILTDVALDLDGAADSRHDPEAREDLEEAGFVAGHLRDWWASDGRRIHVDAFAFQDSEGALEYQRSVTRYACDFANEHFDAPGGGVGLQVRYETGDPIVEQISWVAGSRRYLVSVRHLATPPDHTRVLEIYERATR